MTISTIAEAGFLSKKFTYCTSEARKARQFQSIQKIFLPTRNDLAFTVSDVQFGNSVLINRPLSIQAYYIPRVYFNPPRPENATQLSFFCISTEAFLCQTKSHLF
jgi:hypothetical protein